MPIGKIVAIHGRNISVSVKRIPGDESNDPAPWETQITLPALDLRDVDYAVKSLDDHHNVGFISTNGKITFPAAYNVGDVIPALATNKNEPGS